MTADASLDPLDWTRPLRVAVLALALLTGPSTGYPMLDAITNWVKKAGSTKLGESKQREGSCCPPGYCAFKRQSQSEHMLYGAVQCCPNYIHT